MEKIAIPKRSKISDIFDIYDFYGVFLFFNVDDCDYVFILDTADSGSNSKPYMCTVLFCSTGKLATVHTYLFINLHTY